VVVVLRIASGYNPEYLLKEVATGRENYYTGAVAEGEPPGRWWGAGAERLGLAGLVDAQDMRGLYERFLDPRADGFKDPKQWDDVPTLGHTGRKYKSEDELYSEAVEREPHASPERRAELRVQAGTDARHNVAFLDLTFSVQKSVTLLHTAFEAQEVAARNAGDETTAAAWAEFRTAVEDAIWAGNNAMLDYMSRKAGYSRVGHHGGAAGRFVDAHDWVVASFFQHDSRDHDPQLHIHNGTLNRVQGPDGVWRTLDSRAIHKWRAAAAAVAERTCEERLTHAIGLVLAMRPDGKAREIVGVSPEAMSLISTRRHAVTAKVRELIEAFETRRGRGPNGLERDRLSQQATLVTRRAKSHQGETREQVLDRVDATLRADIDGGLAEIANTALAARENGVQVQEWSPQAVLETALAEVQSRSAGWTESDLIRAINDALPDYLGITDGADVAALLDQLAAEALTMVTPLDAPRPGDELLPDELRVANGRSAYEAPGARLYATPDQVQTERALVSATTAGGAAALPREVAQRFLAGMAESGIELGVDQAAAVRGVLTSGARVETLIGPAGTGKSFVVGTIARGWTDPSTHGGPERRVFGLATSQIATEVLKDEGLTASNIAAWLGTQRRLSAGGGSVQSQAREADLAWRLHAGDLVVVDESAMTDTAALAAIHFYADTAGAKLLLVGDHRQLAAVGAGGGMDLIAASGARYELAEARRFTHDWEKDATLQLRAGDETVLGTYHRHGRLLDSGTTDKAEASAARAWLGDTLAGQRSLLIVDTNEQAAHVSAEIRAELVRLGRVEEDGVVLGLQGTTAGVGDLVEARAIAWDLAGYEGNPRGVINRERFHVTAVRPDGGLEVAPLDSASLDGAGDAATLVLSPDYVAQHLALGYASTVHAAQGGTVDTTHTVVTARTGPGALYVGMSRGRESNTAHVATITAIEDPAHGGPNQLELHRDPVAVLGRILDTTDQTDAANRSATATADASTTAAASARTAAELLIDASQLAATERTTIWLDQLVDTGTLTVADRARIAAEDGAPTLTRILRRAELAGHDPQQVLHEAVTSSSFDGARNLANVLYSRIRHDYRHQLEPIGDTFTDWTPKVDNPDWTTYLAQLARDVDDRAATLGQQATTEPPAWAIDAFGPVPDDAEQRATWARDVGRVQAYREVADHDNPADALGAAPASGQVEQYAAYQSAWRALGRPEIGCDTMQLTDGQLRVRIRAAEREEKWGPRYVANELAGTRQAMATHQQTAQLRDAESVAATDPGERERLRTEAAQARALVDRLAERVAQLQLVDDARAAWLAHSAVTRVNGAECRAEFSRRHLDDVEPEPRTTAEEWLAAHRQALADDEDHRAIADTDLHDSSPDELDDDTDEVVQQDAPRNADPDIREIAATEPAQTGEDRVRVASADEAAASVDGARRALHEINARTLADQEREAEERAAQLALWHTDDHADTDETGDVDDDTDDMVAVAPL
jgi:conjugative relaxase-like TrwC/TraI family protein